MADPMDVDGGRGTPTAGIKRKAPSDEAPQELRVPRRIRALSPQVVNKIAAGEIIVAPVNALKELLENCIDAGATAVEVVVKDGGLKLLQITDNGCGIQKEDLSILCERHTTSKLVQFEDLASIATYGFRGEALASISHIAHLSVQTKTKTSESAYKAYYQDGNLVPGKPGQSAEPKRTAGRQGTQITVEDMFYNVPTRRRAFRSTSDEYAKIVDMVGRYAIHCSGVSFSCKKQGDSSMSVTVPASATIHDRIRQIYGSNIANELAEFSAAEARWGFKAEGWTTNANYHVKKTTLLLFINHRCVDSTAIKKAIEQLYSTFLPKGGHPFIYISLEIDPARLDVNVHPTKREVHFLNEDEIIQSICENIRSKLAAVDTSRNFLTQTLLPSGKWSVPSVDSPQSDRDPPDGTSTAQTPALKRPRRNSNNLVRTDMSARKITSMFSRAGEGGDTPRSARPRNDDADDIEYEIVEREHTPCRLQSIKELRSEVREDMHHELTEVFSSHTYVGIVDERRRLAAVQGGVRLFLIDYGQTCYEFFYQVGLTDFGNFGAVRFSPPLDIRMLLRVAAEIEKNNLDDPESFDTEAIIEKVVTQLVERREMLTEYFSLEVTPTGELVTIPLLIRGYTPPIVKLPRFLLRLGPMVDWTEEKACFETFLRELATFYVPEQLPPTMGDDDEESTVDDPVDEEIRTRRKHVRRAVEHVFFPAFQARLVATKALMDTGVKEIANLKGLYRVFERC